MNANTLRIIQLALSLIGEGFQVLGQTKVIKPNTANTVATIANVLLQALQPTPQQTVDTQHNVIEENTHAV
ncbi:hypothetical protein [Nostoc sp. 'Peltigera membranacea cyanobiont' 232]|uniref:hypothetical protein n=1 Tax=Nostoc sp. 'Peltigera membranacea cyanobiont' 232 TaxID=2014531 RepID=UPI000B95B7FB|nr:hypothetical protein [Nostoc sp. 'Peltigera membranacea cyanobiont' 232]OYE02140.1 hypothetical protein CDG79_25565 [Nostoc sp. 'Peltigera membranacea cyanobiont' 232]